MAEKFILHVGFHKTGTTAIQASLFAAQSQLAAAGITYPSRASHGAAWSVSEKVWGWAKRGGRLTPQSKWRKFVRKANASKGIFLASSEFFTEITPEQIQRIKQEIKAHEYQIVFTIRPLVKMLASSYQQYLKYGLKADYSKWLHEMLDEPGSSKMTPSFWRRNFHGEAIAKWAKVFGVENVTVIVVDETKPEFLYDAFTDYLGLAKGVLTKQEAGGNRSLTAEEAAVLRLLNNQFPKDRAWDDYSIFVRQTAIRALTDKDPHSSGTKLQTPKWAVAKAEKLTEQAVEQIQASGVKVIGDLQNLKQSKVPTGEDAVSEMIPIQTMVDALLAFEQGVIRKMRWRVVLGEIPRRVKVRIFTKARMSSKERNVEDGE
jgi:hypothetical protein